MVATSPGHANRVASHAKIVASKFTTPKAWWPLGAKGTDVAAMLLQDLRGKFLIPQSRATRDHAKGVVRNLPRPVAGFVIPVVDPPTPESGFHRLHDFPAALKSYQIKKKSLLTTEITVR